MLLPMQPAGPQWASLALLTSGTTPSMVTRLTCEVVGLRDGHPRVVMHQGTPGSVDGRMPNTCERDRSDLLWSRCRPPDP